MQEVDQLDKKANETKLPEDELLNEDEMFKMGFKDWLEVAENEINPLKRMEYYDKALYEKSIIVKELLELGLYEEAFEKNPNIGHIFLSQLDITNAKKCFEKDKEQG